MEPSVALNSNVLVILVALAVAIVALYKWRFGYWKRRGLGTLPPTIPLGNVNFVENRPLAEVFKEVYDQFKAKGWRHGGFYTGYKVSYIPVDLEIVKCILQNDFSHFSGRGFFVNTKVDPLNANLFHLDGAKWRNLRVRLAPTFSSGKMKGMFQTMLTYAQGLRELIDDGAASGKPVDVMEIMTRFTTDVIGSVAFGLETDSLKNPDSELRIYGKRIFEFTTYDKYRRVFRQYMPEALIRWLGMKFIKQDIETFFMNTINSVVGYRMKNNVERKDFIQLLLQLLKNPDKDVGLTMDELSAQAFVFFQGGFETSSSTMTWALYELGLNQDIQNKLREEINSVLSQHNGQITYDAIMEMTYLDKVLFETLRKYPVIGILPRVCTKDYIVPGTTVKIDKGTPVVIPYYAIHRDPEYFPDPDRFDPERFSKENIAKRHPFAHLPFGEGPRFCIGMRFGIMQVKLGLTTVLSNYKITLNEQTEVPLRIAKTAFVNQPKGRVLVTIQRITQ